MKDSDSIMMLGIQVHNVTMKETVERIETFVRERGPHLIVTLGTEMVVDAQKNAKFRETVNQASLVLPDGGGLVWASRVLGEPLRERVAGIDLIQAISKESGEKRWKIFLLGGKPGIADAAASELTRKFPGVNIVGIHHGYFRDEEVLPILEKVKPDILLAGMGFPRQEFWLSEHLASLGIPVGIGVGGSFDVLAGRLKRAPAWMIRFNLEWLFRFFQQPTRFRRMLKIPYFIGLIYRERFFR